MVDVASKGDLEQAVQVLGSQMDNHVRQLRLNESSLRNRVIKLESDLHDVKAGGDNLEIDWEDTCHKAWRELEDSQERVHDLEREKATLEGTIDLLNMNGLGSKTVPRVIPFSEVKVGQVLASAFPDGSGAHGRVTEFDGKGNAIVENYGTSGFIWGYPGGEGYLIVLLREADQETPESGPFAAKSAEPEGIREITEHGLKIGQKVNARLKEDYRGRSKGDWVTARVGVGGGPMGSRFMIDSGFEHRYDKFILVEDVDIKVGYAEDDHEDAEITQFHNPYLGGRGPQ